MPMPGTTTGAAKAAGKAAEKAATPQSEAARALAKALWDREFKASHPDATPEAKKAGWQTSRADYVKVGRQLVARLEKAGFTIAGPAEKG